MDVIPTRTDPPERGASAAEYALIAALIAVVIVAAVVAFGGAVANLFNLTWPTP
ncbi:MAG TPA: Flp family type IVb pilin [Nocardioides sp.]|nr:Flp family type IVb pilin [Nocardioides sp.]